MFRQAFLVDGFNANLLRFVQIREQPVAAAISFAPEVHGRMPGDAQQPDPHGRIAPVGRQGAEGADEGVLGHFLHVLSREAPSQVGRQKPLIGLDDRGEGLDIPGQDAPDGFLDQRLVGGVVVFAHVQDGLETGCGLRQLHFHRTAEDSRLR